MELQGRVIAILPEQRINGKNGEITKNFFVIETNEQHANKIKFEVFGDERWKNMDIAEGQSVSVSFDIRGAEWKGNYFVNLAAWKVVHLEGSTPKTEPQPQPQPQQQPKTQQKKKVETESPQVPTADGNDQDDLPF